jgi:hypothetical protein
VLAIILAGCAAQEAPAPDHAALVEACAVALAKHVGKEVDAVTASWTGSTADGMGIVTVSDVQAARVELVHTCEVDGAGRVLALRHPGA